MLPFQKADRSGKSQNGRLTFKARLQIHLQLMTATSYNPKFSHFDCCLVMFDAFICFKQ